MYCSNNFFIAAIKNLFYILKNYFNYFNIYHKLIYWANGRGIGAVEVLDDDDGLAGGLDEELRRSVLVPTEVSTMS